MVEKEGIKSRLLKGVKQLFSQETDSNASRFDLMHDKCKTMLEEIYEPISVKVDEQLRKFCRDNNVSTDVREKQQSELARKKEYFKNSALNYVINLICNVIMDRIQKVGDATLNEFINNFLR